MVRLFTHSFFTSKFESSSLDGRGNNGIENPTTPESRLSWKSDTLGVLGVTVIVLLLFWPTLNGSRTIMSDMWRVNYPWAREVALADEAGSGSDIALQNLEDPYLLEADIYFQVYPWYAIAQKELLSGRWPHWNKHAYCGAPLYANHLVPVHHPPLLLALLFAPLQQVYTVAAFLAYWLGGLGIYFYLRILKLRPSACLTAVGLYLTCGHYMMLWTYQLPGIMYYPWILIALHAWEARPTFGRIIPLSLLLGMMFSSGHPAYTIPFLYLVFLYPVITWIFARRQRVWWGPRLAYLVLALVMVGLFTAPQNLPIYQLLRHSSREIVQDAATYRESQPSPAPANSNIQTTRDQALVERDPSKLARIFAPVFQRNYGEMHSYVGLPLFLLALLGMLKMKPIPERNAMLVLLGIFTILSVPKIYAMVMPFIPGFSLSPYVPFDQPQILLVIFAGFGAHSLLSDYDHHDRKLTLAFGAVSLLSAIGLVAMFVPGSISSPDTRWEIEHLGLAKVVLGLGLIATILPILSLWRGVKQPWLAGVLMPVMLILSGLYAHFYQHPVYETVPFMPETRSTAALPTNPEFRIIRHTSGPRLHEPTIEDPITFGANLPTWVGCYDTQGTGAFILATHTEMLKSLEPGSIIWNRLALPITEPDTLSSPLLDAMAVGYLISDDPDLLLKPDSGMSPEDWALEHDGGLVIYRRLNALPRWYFADEAIIASADDEILELVKEVGLRSSYPDGEIITRVVLAPDTPELQAGGEFTGGEISLVSENAQYLKFEVSTPIEKYFVLSDSNYPEWHGYVDGVEVPIYLANGAYRAVLIPGGDHIVEFKYVPGNFRTGLLISIVSLVVLLFAAVLQKKLGQN